MDHNDIRVFQASKDVAASHGALIDIFERIENFFSRLEIHIEVPQTPAMTDIMVKIMVEVLSVFAIATKEIKQGRASKLFPTFICASLIIYSEKFFKKLMGRRDIEDSLAKLDKLTQEEARLAIVEVKSLTHKVDDKVKIIEKGVQGVDGKVERIVERAQAIDYGVQQVDQKVGVANDTLKQIVDGS